MRSFIYLSRCAGMRDDLAQAGGGNSSVKLSPTKMLIKASGFSLADVGENVGYCAVNPQVIVDYFSKDGFEISANVEKELISNSLLSLSAQESGRPLRPSIETFLHSITQKYTLHTHPTVVNILAATDEGWDTLKNLFPDALFVDYETPGIKLAAKYFKAFKAFGKIPDVIFLKNHGLVVNGETGEVVKKKMDAILDVIEKYLGLDMERHHNATIIYDVTRQVPVLKDKIVWLAQNRDIGVASESFGVDLWEWQFCPDCLVYCGKRALVLGDAFAVSDFERHIETFGIPVVVSLRGNVYIVADNVKKAKDIECVLAFSAQVALANKKLKLNLLSVDEQNFLLNWDAEKYRQTAK